MSPALARKSGVNVTVRNLQSRKRSGLKVDTAHLKKIASRTLQVAGGGDSSLSIVLVDDKTIARLNQQFHHTEGPTDVLSFDYGGKPATGELVISVERAVAQAKTFRSTPGHELVLYVVHGVLHLQGYNDLTPRKRSRMRAAERRIITRLSSAFNLRGLVGRGPR